MSSVPAIRPAIIIEETRVRVFFAEGIVLMDYCLGRIKIGILVFREIRFKGIFHAYLRITNNNIQGAVCNPESFGY